MKNHKTISISLPPEMSDRVDDMAKRKGMNRSSFIKYALAGQMRQEDAFDNMPEIVEALKKLGNMPDDKKT